MIIKQTDLRLASDLRTVLTRLIKKLRKKSESSMTLSLTERSTMSLLDQYGELMPSELASMEKITNQSMSQILGHLESLGYIRRRNSKADRRKFLISLSPKGTAMLNRMRGERDNWLLSAITKTCTQEEIDRLKVCLGTLSRLVEYEE